MDPEQLSDAGNLLGLDFSPSVLIAGLIFGVVGFYAFRIGKKNSNLKLVILGMILMVYPLFVSGAKMTWGIGILLSAAAYHFKDDPA